MNNRKRFTIGFLRLIKPFKPLKTKIREPPKKKHHDPQAQRQETIPKRMYCPQRKTKECLVGKK